MVTNGLDVCIGPTRWRRLRGIRSVCRALPIFTCSTIRSVSNRPEEGGWARTKSNPSAGRSCSPWSSRWRCGEWHVTRQVQGTDDMKEEKTCNLGKMRGLAAAALIAVSLVVLAGCSGGKQSSSALVPATLAPPPAPPPRDPAEKIVDLLRSGNVDSLLITDAVAKVTLGEIAAGSARVHVSCSGDTCTMSHASFNILGLGLQTVDIGEDLSVADLELSSIPDDAIGGISSRTINGVHVAQLDAFEDLALEDLGAASGFLGGWLDHQIFAVGAAEDSDPAQEYKLEASLAMSFGDATGTVPTSGGATWNGAVLGIDTASEGELVEGRARITIDNFSDPNVDAAFTRIVGVDDGEPRQDMTWNDIPVTGTGFKTGAAGDSIEGRFYGPGHQEVGGVFERAEIIGAFGAARP